MKRLTYEKENGEWGLNGYDIKKVPKELYGAICKLHEYEDLGLTPEELRQIDDMYAVRCKEISDLKKQIEQEKKPEEMSDWKSHIADRFLRME